VSKRHPEAVLVTASLLAGCVAIPGTQSEKAE
jgi:hypothetical protein